MTSNLAQSAGRGVAITIVAQIARLAIQLTSVVVLSRLLTPTDYGLVAIVLVVIAFGETFRDFGLSSASIQAKTLSRDQRSNLFWINAGIGAVLGLIVYIGAGTISALVGSPDVKAIAEALSLAFLVNGLATQFRASLLRALRFRVMAFIDVGAALVALAAAVVVAAAGGGFWALVTQQLGVGILVLAGCATAGRWIPGLPNRRGSIRGFLQFGLTLVGSQLIAYASSNIDTLIVGLRFGTTSLGFYNRAFQIVMTPVNQIRVPLTTVALPILYRLQATNERFNDYVAIGQLGLGYPLCLALGAASLLADPLTTVALGSQWQEAAPILRLLAISAVFQTLAYVGYWVYVSRGLGPALFKFSIVSAAIRITAILVGSQFGLVGVAAGYMIGSAINWPISIGWLSRVTTIPTRRLYLGAGRILLVVVWASCLSGLVAFVALPDLPATTTLIVGLVAYTAAVPLALLIPWYREDLRSMLRIVAIIRGRNVE